MTGQVSPRLQNCVAELPIWAWVGVGAVYTAGKAAPEVREPVPVLTTCTDDTHSV